MVSSCGNSRETVNPERLEHKSDRELENALFEQNKIPFEHFAVRIGVDIKSKDQNASLSCYLKVHVDTAIGGTAKALVIVATFKVTNDSIILVKKLDKCYFAETLGYVSTLFGTTLEFDFLQSLILGLPVGLEEGTKYEQIRDRDQDHYILSSHKRRDFIKLEQNKLNAEEEEMFIQYHMRNNLELFQIDVQIPSDTTAITVNYNERKLEEGFSVPEETKIVISHPKDTITILLNYGTVKLNEPSAVEINIPDSYLECP